MAAILPATRYRVRFQKRLALRYISHLDLMRVFELALRRSGLKVAHTQGFNPRPKLSFAHALPLGVESLDEIVDLDLDDEPVVAPNEMLERLQPVLPNGLKLLSAEIATGRPQLASAEYEARLDLTDEQRASVESKLQQFLDADEWHFVRDRGRKKPPKRFDARAFCHAADLTGDVLTMTLQTGQDGAMKPSDLLDIVGLDPLQILVTKTKTNLIESCDERS